LGDALLERKASLGVDELSVGRDGDAPVRVLDAGMARGEPSVHRVELLPHVAGQVWCGGRGEDEQDVRALGSFDRVLGVVVVLVEEGLAADRPAVGAQHAAPDAVAAERPHGEIESLGGDVFLDAGDEVTRRGAADRTRLNLQAERSRHELDVGLGLGHERVAVDDHPRHR
jgi:hypothetical protein